MLVETRVRLVRMRDVQMACHVSKDTCKFPRVPRSSLGRETKQDRRHDVDSSRKTALYREVNATTEAMLKQFEADHAGSFLCECADVGCDRRLALTHEEYEGVRLSGAYLVALDCIRDAEVLARTDRYAIVEFRGGVTEGPGSSPSGWSRSESSQRVWSQPAPSPRARSLTAAARTAAAARAEPRLALAARRVHYDSAAQLQAAATLAAVHGRPSPSPLPPAF